MDRVSSRLVWRNWKTNGPIVECAPSSPVGAGDAPSAEASIEGFNRLLMANANYYYCVDATDGDKTVTLQLPYHYYGEMISIRRIDGYQDREVNVVANFQEIRDQARLLVRKSVQTELIHELIHIVESFVDETRFVTSISPNTSVSIFKTPDSWHIYRSILRTQFYAYDPVAPN